MNLVKIINTRESGFISVIPAHVSVYPVASINEAQKKLKELVKDVFNDLDITVEPTIDDKNYRSLDDNSPTDDYEAQRYSLSTIKKPDVTIPVAEIDVVENGEIYTWFCVE
jgi:hypothetical protein